MSDEQTYTIRITRIQGGDRMMGERFGLEARTAQGTIVCTAYGGYREVHAALAAHIESIKFGLLP